jgi:hypothetical protein
MPLVLTPTTTTQKHYGRLVRTLLLVDILIVVVSCLTFLLGVVNATQISDSYVRFALDQTTSWVSANVTIFLTNLVPPFVTALIAAVHIYAWIWMALYPVLGMCTELLLFGGWVYALSEQVTTGDYKGRFGTQNDRHEVAGPSNFNAVWVHHEVKDVMVVLGGAIEVL